MEVVLNIPNSTDWISLYPLLQRLGISVVRTKILPADNNHDDEKDWELIMKGIKIDNVNEFMAEFEASRQDRTLPFRD